MACDEQIRKAGRHPQAMGVLRQPAIADLGEAEHPLDDADTALDLGTDGGLGAILSPFHRIDNPAMAIAPVGKSRALGARARIAAFWPRYAWSP